MIPVYQLINSLSKGDCFRACVASILELPIEEVPNFMEDGEDKFNDHIVDWIKDRTFTIRYVEINNDDDQKEFEQTTKDHYVIAIGQNAFCYHAVVWRNGKIVHDPNPNGRYFPFLEKPTAFVYFEHKGTGEILF